MNELLKALADYKGPWFFWCCDTCRGNVTWRKEGDTYIAKCDECGKESQPKKVAADNRKASS